MKPCLSLIGIWLGHSSHGGVQAKTSSFLEKWMSQHGLKLELVEPNFRLIVTIRVCWSPRYAQFGQIFYVAQLRHISCVYIDTPYVFACGFGIGEIWAYCLTINLTLLLINTYGCHWSRGKLLLVTILTCFILIKLTVFVLFRFEWISENILVALLSPFVWRKKVCYHIGEFRYQ